MEIKIPMQIKIKGTLDVKEPEKKKEEKNLEK